MKRITAITLITSVFFTACSTSKKSADTGTADAAAPKENQARVEKVTAPPANTQAQKAEILYDK